MQDFDYQQEIEVVQTLVDEGFDRETAFHALIDCQGNINKARKTIIRNQAQPVPPSQPTSGDDNLQQQQPQLSPSTPKTEMQDFDLLQESEVVQTLVDEGYDRETAFRALLDCQGNINKARKALNRNKTYPY